jgi:hypothetical protein
MSDLVEWLTAILDEDEKAAERAGGSITEMRNDNYGQLLVPPGWVLADIAAKRTILALGICAACDVEMQPCDHRDDTLRLLATAYADRPGYREEWRP